MRIYYRTDSLCSRQSGNGKKIPFLSRCLYSLCTEEDLHPFSMADINSILFNKHQSIGCSIDAPLAVVGWQSESQWYELFGDEEIFLPKCIVFTNGDKSYSIVIVGDAYELRVWNDSHCKNRDKSQWFSHEPIVYDTELSMLKQSFTVLLGHIKREDELEAKNHDL